MKEASDLIPWKVTDISIRPYSEMWSMNPSLHFDGSLWRCVLRCTDYAMPNGVTIRSTKARPGAQQTKNAMVLFDPQTWKPIQIFKMAERDDYPRTTCANVGYEDMRIFVTDRGGLQGIAASLHLDREGSGVKKQPGSTGGKSQPPEQVLLSFDAEYNIVKAHPIRGRWSGTPQKNWVPFDRCVEPRFLYSIAGGTLFDVRGAMHGSAVNVQPSSAALSAVPYVPIAVAPSEPELEPVPQAERSRERKREDRHARRQAIRGNAAAQMVRGRRVAADSLSTRPSTRPVASAGTSARHTGVRGGSGSSRMLGTGRVLLPRYQGLRGGSQLLRVGDNAWLGIGHEMQFLKGKKYYWHTWYLVDDRGSMKAASPPMKLVPNGIEFAAGMAIDGERVVVSFGVDDMECKVGETALSAVMGLLAPIKR